MKIILLLAFIALASCGGEEQKKDNIPVLKTKPFDPLGNVDEVIPLADGGAYVKTHESQGLYYVKGTKMWPVTMDNGVLHLASNDTTSEAWRWARSEYYRRKAAAAANVDYGDDQ